MDYTILIILFVILFFVVYICYNDIQNRETKTHETPERSLDDYDELLDDCITETETYSMIKKMPLNKAFIKLQGFGHLARRVVPDFPILKESDITCIPERSTYASIGERISIETCEKIFGKSFPKVRPDWLRNDKTNRCMEIDGYCEELKIGIEYNGSQHYCFPNFINNSREDFDNQLYRDKRKTDICYNKGICLIAVPYTVSHKKIPLYIYSKLLDSVPGAPEIFEY